MNQDEQQIIRVLARTTYLGLFINVMAPIGLFVVAMTLTGGITGEGGLGLDDRPMVRFLFFVFLGMSVIDFIVCLIIRKSLPARLISASGGSPSERFAGAARNIALVIFIFNALYSVYGLVLVALGAQIEVMMLFVAFSLIGYQFLRPRRAFLERLMDITAGDKS